MDAKSKLHKAALAAGTPSRNGGEAQTWLPTYGGVDSILEWPVIDIVWPVVESNPAAPLLAWALAGLYLDGTIGSYLQARRNGGSERGQETCPAVAPKAVAKVQRLAKVKSPLVDELQSLQKELQRLKNRLGMKPPPELTAALQARTTELEAQIKSLRTQLKDRKKAAAPRTKPVAAEGDGKSSRGDSHRDRRGRRGQAGQRQRAATNNPPARATPVRLVAVVERVSTDAKGYLPQRVGLRPPSAPKPARRGMGDGYGKALLDCPEAKGFVPENEAPATGASEALRVVVQAPKPVPEKVPVKVIAEALADGAHRGIEPGTPAAAALVAAAIAPKATPVEMCYVCRLNPAAVEQKGKKICQTCADTQNAAKVACRCDGCGGVCSHVKDYVWTRRRDKGLPVQCQNCRLHPNGGNNSAKPMHAPAKTAVPATTALQPAA